MDAIETLPVDRELNEENRIGRRDSEALAVENRLRRRRNHQQCTERISTDLSD